MSLYDSHISNLTAAELERLLNALAHAANDADAELLGKLRSELERRRKIEAMLAKVEAEQAVYAANVDYVRNHMKPGDVVEYRFRNWSRSGNEITRRMRVESFQIGESQASPSLSLKGVVLTKSGKPHATLNNYGYAGSGHHWEYGLSLGDVRLIEAAPAVCPAGSSCSGAEFPGHPAHSDAD